MGAWRCPLWNLSPPAAFKAGGLSFLQLAPWVLVKYNRRINQGYQRENMSTQRIYQLLISFIILAVIAFISERSRVLASVVSVMPLTITFALWFVSTSTGADAVISAEFSRMMTLGLIPTMLFTTACWFGFRRGWSVGRVVIVGYAVWLATMGLYRGIEWWLKTTR